MSKKRLDRDFFMPDVVQVAQALLGKVLVVGSHQVVITETEAYRGNDDPAAHSFRGKTPRTEVMFGIGGVSYVYFIYGMYYCLNFVTGPVGEPSAVLIRAAHNLEDPSQVWNGPGKLCRALEIDKSFNNIDVVTSKSFYLYDAKLKVVYDTTPRIGISKAKERKWRFVAHTIDK
jgi:DNA-3-methyladenine glycosylase